ncbi:MAG: hypothetical protein ACI3T9_04990 [Romboutsia timonensis]
MINKLLEDSRSQLISKGRSAEREKGDGKTRYEKRVKSRVAPSTRQYNQINMNQLFKDNILTVNIEVKGETNDYIVTISFGGFLDEVKSQLKKLKLEEINLRLITRALVNSFNSENVYLRCSCPDFHYRAGYWTTKDNIIYGEPENRPSSITNPSNKLGPGCKHVMLVLSNHSWLLKVASVICNYINYMKTHSEKQYADIIYPALYGKEYQEPVQLDIFDNQELETDKDTLDKSNIEAQKKGQFKPGNKYRFTKQPDKNQVNISNIESKNDIEEPDEVI